MSDPITAPPIARSGHQPMEAVHVDERSWETLRWTGQWSKMLFHPSADRPTEPNAGLVRYEPGAHHPQHKPDFAQAWYILEADFRIGGRGEETLGLGGRAVLPGLVDGHGHLMHLARARLSFDCRGLASEEEIARRVGERAATRPRGEWITGRNWDQNLWPGRHFPSKATLDQAAPDHPVALMRIDGHATWANSAALA